MQQQLQSEYPLVAVPHLMEDDFVHGDGFTTFAVHPMAGYPQFIVEAYGVTFLMELTSSEGLGSYFVFEYVDYESEMVAYISDNLIPLRVEKEMEN